MDFIGRDVWGAQYPAGSGSRSLPCTEAWLHHSVTSTLPVTATVEQESVEMRRVERIGQTKFGQGFSYNLAAFPSGRLYVGCGVRRVGAHTGGRNTRALGVVLMGNYDVMPLPAPLRAVLPDLLRFAFKEGWIDRAAFDGGHRDVPGASTACPGRHAYAALPGINADALRPPGALLTSPAPAVGAQLTGGPSMIVVKEPNGNRQFLCDRDGASHLGGPERDLLVAGGVPYLGDEHNEQGRLELLARRGVEGL